MNLIRRTRYRYNSLTTRSSERFGAKTAHDNMKISLQLFELVLKKLSPGILLVISIYPAEPLQMEYVICTKKSIDFNRM